MAVLFRLTSLATAALFWMVAGGVAVFAITIITSIVGFALGPVFLFCGPMGGLLLLIMLGVMIRRIRERRAMLVLSQLDQTIRLNLPLPDMLFAAQMSETGATRRRFVHLRDAVEVGMPLGDAVAAHVPELSPRAVSLIAAAERVGQLPATLRRLVSETRHEPHEHEPEHAFVWAYAVILLLALMLIFSGICLFVLPMFREIFVDFDAPMPWMTEVTFALAETWAPQALLTMVVLLALAAAGHATWQVLHMPDREPKPWASLVDHLVWWVPGLRGMARDRALADAFQFVADALRAGQPLESALVQASELRVNAVARRRLRRWADAVHAGDELGDAARAARLPALACGILGPAQVGGDTARAFAFLGRYYQFRFSRLAEIGRAAVLPLVVLTSALLVGWLVLAMFLPLVQLIEVMSADALGGGQL